MLVNLVAVSVAATLIQEPPAPVDAAALVEGVRASEAWIHEVNSFYARFEGGWTRSAAFIAERRAELKKQYPNLTEEQLQQFSDLEPHTEEELAIALDQFRLYKYHHREDSPLDTQMWNGSYVLHIRGAPDDPESYYLDDDTQEGIGRHFFIDLSWLRAASHSFWWNGDEDPGMTDGIAGPARFFEVVGRQEYHGIDCHVLESRGGFITWFVGAEDGLLHGSIQRAFRPNADAFAVFKIQADELGHEWVSAEEFVEWKKTLPRETQDQLAHDYFAAMIDPARPQTEHVLLDYRDVGDGRMFPFRQGYRFFEEEPNEDGDYEVIAERELNATEVTINDPLPDELFEHEMKDGVRTSDDRSDVFITYTYAADMPQERIEELLAERRAQVSEMEAEKEARDELIGEPAFPFPEGTSWLNGDALTWEDLKGKVVILDFFADWCGPCRRDYPTLAEMHRNRAHNQLTIIGIHTPGSELDSIKTLLKQYEMEYPVVIDVQGPEGVRTWGLLYHQYRIFGIPHAVVVGKDGRIAGHGDLHEVHSIASNLVVAEDD